MPTDRVLTRRERRAARVERLLAIYKRWLAPGMHAVGGALTPMASACRYQPTCSEYAAVAIARHGWIRGCALAVWRVLRCHPWSRGGFDPVP